MCVVCVVCVTEAAGGGGGREEARDTESKTRTPHKDVGKKAKKTMVFEQFFTDPPPEGESAKVPPAGSHFGRYFGTLLFGGSPRSGRQCSIDFR